MSLNTTSRFSLVALLGLVGLAAAPGLAQDFNGDGIDDLVVGTPGEDVGGAADAGAVTVIYGSAGGLSAFAPLPATQYLQSTYGYDLDEPGDEFGAAIAWGDFNGDGFDDLAVGAPGETDAAGLADVGAVYLYYGAAAGLIPLGPPVFMQSIIGEFDEAGDRFGAALAAGDFNADGITDLAIGAPGEDLGGAVDAGLVHQLWGTPGGLMPFGAPLPMIGQPMVGDPLEPGDGFGMSLAAGDMDGVPGDDLAIGVPFEDFAGDVDCGMVHVLYAAPGFGLDPGGPTPFEVWTQDSAGVPNVTEPGDLFGYALAVANFDANRAEDLAIGVPSEDLGANADCGMVHVIYSVGPGVGLDAFAPIPNQIWHQNSGGVPEANNAGDYFGWSLAAGSFNGDTGADLAIGVPGEDVGAVVDAGYVNVIYSAGPALGLSAGAAPVAAEGWSQNSPGVPNTNEVGDHSGWSLTVGDFDKNGCFDLAWGVPDEDLGAFVDCGAVNVVYGNTAGGVGLDGFVPIPSQIWHQNIAGIPDANEAGDGFGEALDNDD